MRQLISNSVAGDVLTFANNGVITLTSGSGPDMLGSFTSQKHNLVGQSDGSIGFTNGVNNDVVGTSSAPVNPMIGPPTNNGGTTFTCALLLGSPALEAGDDSLANTLPTDQRGFPRVSGVHPDIGSYPAKLEQGYFQFALTNNPVFSVLVSTNLSQWDYPGPAYQVYQFLDPQAASNAPQRFYRLRYP